MIKKSLLLFGAVAGAMMAIGTSSSNIAASINDANQKINVNCLNPVTNNTAKISGFIKITDDYDVTQNLQGVEVKLLVYLTASRTPTKAKIVGTTYTDLNGKYNFTYSNDAFETIQELREKTAFQIVISAKGEGFYVTNRSGENYSYTGEKFTISKLGYAFYSHTFSTSTYVGKGFSLTQPLVIGYKYAKFLAPNKDIEDVNLIYPDVVENDIACYHLNTIHVPDSSKMGTYKYTFPNSFQDFDVICHEYAHHIQFAFIVGLNLGGTHYIGSCMQDEYLNGIDGLYLNKFFSRELGLRISYAEGWATAYSLLAQRHFKNEIDTWHFAADSSYTAYNRVNYDCAKYSFHKGESDEYTTTSLIWNLFDDDAGICDPWDDICLDESLLISLSQRTFTLYDFVSKIYDMHINTDAMETMLEILNVSPSRIKWDTLYTNIAPTFTWETSNGSINFRNTSYELSLICGNHISSYYINDNGEDKISYQLSMKDWEFVLSGNSDEIKLQITGICDVEGIRTVFDSRTRHIDKPTIAKSNKPNLLILPNSWGFATTYSDLVITKSFVKGGTTFSTKRLRTAGSVDNCLTLSAKKEYCGKAYAEFVSDKAWSAIEYDVSIFSDSEQISMFNSSITVEVLNSRGEWVKDADLWRDIRIKIGKTNMTKVTTLTTGPIYGIRFTVIAEAEGYYDLGRIAIGNIEFKA